MRLLEVGMKLELKEDLDCGLRVISKGEIFEVQSIKESKISLLGYMGIGVFDVAEIEEYFKEYIEEIQVDDDVKKVIYSDRVTVVILNSGVKGIAKCLEEDNYDKEKGYRVAYLKAKIKEMSRELKKY